MAAVTCKVVWSTGVCGKPARPAPERFMIDGVVREGDICPDCWDELHETMAPFIEGSRLVERVEYRDAWDNVWTPREVRSFLLSEGLITGERGRLKPQSIQDWSRRASMDPELHARVRRAVEDEHLVKLALQRAKNDPTLNDEIESQARVNRRRKKAPEN